MNSVCKVISAELMSSAEYDPLVYTYHHHHQEQITFHCRSGLLASFFTIARNSMIFLCHGGLWSRVFSLIWNVFLLLLVLNMHFQHHRFVITSKMERNSHHHTMTLLTTFSYSSVHFFLHSTPLNHRILVWQIVCI